MHFTRRIYFVLYPNSALLDYSGPSGVFAVANELIKDTVYSLHCVSSTGGLIRQNTNVYIDTLAFDQTELSIEDTVLVMGAPSSAIQEAMADPAIKQYLEYSSQTCGRYGSVCTGAFILGAAGLLDHKQTSTHWASQKLLKNSYPLARVNQDALYTVDGNLWTSAGVTTGIDMALAMVEQDLGRSIKSQVAKHLLVYAQRAGHQSQFSDILLAQTHHDDRFAPLVEWLQEHLHHPIKVEDMAHFMAMSSRSFHRHFIHAFGQSPASFFVQLRLNQAQKLLQAGVPVTQVASKVGFKSVSAFRTAFKDFTGITPKFFSGLE
ncbi:helix-turn-helix domain-containing protein [Marinomonas sp. THO17]